MATFVRLRREALALVPEIKVTVARVIVHMDSQGPSLERVVVEGTLGDRWVTILLVTFVWRAKRSIRDS
jgi:hypothetical protein